MSEEKNIIDELLERGYSKQDIHSTLHKCMLQIIEFEKKNKCGGQEMQHPRLPDAVGQEVEDDRHYDITTDQQRKENIDQEMLNQVQHDVVQHNDTTKEIALEQALTQSPHAPRNDGDDITPAKNHPHPVVYFFRKVNIRKHVIGKALSLLRSQFAKKPKNPV